RRLAQRGQNQAEESLRTRPYSLPMPPVASDLPLRQTSDTRGALPRHGGPSCGGVLEQSDFPAILRKLNATPLLVRGHERPALAGRLPATPATKQRGRRLRLRRANRRDGVRR